MNVVVFLGPSLDRTAAREILDVTYLPPVSLGDVYTVARRRPAAIAIIDGYFDRVPAVWHKEILWAMSRGIRVYGASSMGALRAAELEAFGMIGVGRVFEQFRDGVLEDDDEVALMHAPRNFAYAAGSEAMVNMRATFSAAQSEGVISSETCESLISAAKSSFYADRDYERAIARAKADGAAGGECAAFADWLPAGRRDIKREDAIELLRRVAADVGGEAGPARPTYTFHVTHMWEALRNTIEQRPLDDGPASEMTLDDDAIDELRLTRESYLREREQSLTRLLSVELSSVEGHAPSPLAMHLAAESLRERHELPSREALDQWLAGQKLTPEAGALLVEDEARVRHVMSRYRVLLPAYMRDHLRANGRYADLERRAREKHAVLWRRGLHNPSLANAGLTEAELWEWFFGQPVDLEAEAARLEFASLDMMRRAVLREFLYREVLAPALTGTP